MGVFTLQIPGLSLGPRFRLEGKRLTSRSNLMYCLLTWFLHFKRISADTAQGVIRIRRRMLWFLRSEKVVRFSEIKRIDYSYHEFRLFTGGETSDGIDHFIVSLVLADESLVKLWSFIGEGTAMTSDIAFRRSEGMLDFEGSQETDSLYFVELLQYLTGKPLTRYS